jgi:hypothetical protein
VRPLQTFSTQSSPGCGNPNKVEAFVPTTEHFKFPREGVKQLGSIIRYITLDDNLLEMSLEPGQRSIECSLFRRNLDRIGLDIIRLAEHIE